jgi:(p)ppGpp synthase/HD superfamily hydrolase
VNPVGQAIVSDDARTFLDEAYARRRAGEGSEVEHPLKVARLLHDDGQRQEVVLAGLLHDLLEDTEVTTAEVRGRFGREVAEVVEALTQDPAIAEYGRRKAALRAQIVNGGRDAATVALADKCAKLEAEPQRPDQQRLEHYRATLHAIVERYGESRLSERLRRDLARFGD